MAEETWVKFYVSQATPEDLIKSGDIKVTGDAAEAARVINLFDRYVPRRPSRSHRSRSPHNAERDQARSSACPLSAISGHRRNAKLQRINTVRLVAIDI
jgi:hypothetical protein